MNSKELKKYVGKKISFDINDVAHLPLPKVKGKDLRNNSHHFEGVLCENDGRASHFALLVFSEDGYATEGIAIRDADIPYIENFKLLEN